MLDLASRANRRIQLPSPKQSRARIIKMFKQQLCLLRDRLNGPTVVGEVSLTCDAWQADNTDAYFAVTGHWIEERTPGEWTVEQALLGFTQMNTAHNGARLGQALYKLCNRVRIIPKVGHITCDNAKNNDTMLQEFARCYEIKMGSAFDVKRRHIRCLAHIVNLATQAVISTRSKSKYFNGDPDDDHLPEDLGATERDEIGLVRSICVKARSSAQRKEAFKAIQYRQKVPPLQLLLDMKVRWSSTFVMLTRAESRRRAIDEFLLELRLKETNLDKRRKITDLSLDDEEWTRVRLFCNVLQHADDAQQAFSSASAPTLQNALPALEKMHVAWEKASAKPRYACFIPALTAGMDKLNNYYQRSAASDAHIMAMVLNPKKKMGHFIKHWPAHLIEEVEDIVRVRFTKRFEELNKKSQPQAPRVCKALPSSKPGRHRNTDDTDTETDDDDCQQVVNADNCWIDEWKLYFNTHEVVLDGVGIARWWGLYGGRYPTWRSLARDYLAIMASSVSSERAFSSAGITICKWRNRLNADIVEALQCLKSIIHQDLMVRDFLSIAEEEAELDYVDEQPSNQDSTPIEVVDADDDVAWEVTDDGGNTADISGIDIEIDLSGSQF